MSLEAFNLHRNTLLVLAVLLSAVAGIPSCGVFNNTRYLCNSIPGCLWESATFTCRSDDEPCISRHTSQWCQIGVRCAWNSTTYSCTARDLSHAPEFEYCRQRVAGVIDPFDFPYATCVASGCRWDGQLSYCVPHYETVCPVRAGASRSLCESTPGCVWRASVSQCVGLAPTNRDCTEHDAQPTSCIRDDVYGENHTCVFISATQLCNPRPAWTLDGDPELRLACNADFNNSKSGSCTPGERCYDNCINGTRILYCNRTALAPFYCDALSGLLTPAPIGYVSDSHIDVTVGVVVVCVMVGGILFAFMVWGIAYMTPDIDRISKLNRRKRLK